MSDPIVTVSLIHYSGWRHRWWAFTQMGLGPGALAEVAGLRFIKLLGSGGGNGFSIWPNFGAYALVASWESEARARQFFAEHAYWQNIKRHSNEQLTAYLRTAMVHGRWDGQEPFTPTAQYEAPAPVAVITRATIRPEKVVQFWRYVPRVSASVAEQSACLLSIGIGEYPLFMQATFSIWENGKAMQDYAYRSRHHREAVEKTRELQWYKEELFARFAVSHIEGSWQGRKLSLPAARAQE